MKSTRTRYQVKALACSPSSRIAINYIKHRFHVGALFSIPKPLFDVARPGTIVQTPEPISAATFLQLVKPCSSGKDDEFSVHDLVFFEIVDAFPEAQYAVHVHFVIRQVSLGNGLLPRGSLKMDVGVSQVSLSRGPSDQWGMKSGLLFSPIARRSICS